MGFGGGPQATNLRQRHCNDSRYSNSRTSLAAIDQNVSCVRDIDRDVDKKSLEDSYHELPFSDENFATPFDQQPPQATPTTTGPGRPCPMLGSPRPSCTHQLFRQNRHQHQRSQPKSYDPYRDVYLGEYCELEGRKTGWGRRKSREADPKTEDQDNPEVERRRSFWGDPSSTCCWRRNGSSRDFRRVIEMAGSAIFLAILLLVTPGLCHQDAVHITAILGESVVFNCHVEFPDQHPVPYVLQWEKKVGDTVRYRAKSATSTTSSTLLSSIRELKTRAPFVKGMLLIPEKTPIPDFIRDKFTIRTTLPKDPTDGKTEQGDDSNVRFMGQEIPIYIWYESYPTHSGEGYEGRVSKVSQNSPYGVASLNLTKIQESDQGWYECKVVFLNRSPNNNKNGTWFHLDVHAPPRFTITPEEMIYVNLGDAIILNCQAEGTPTPEILWYKDASPVEPSSTIRIMNEGTELRISMIKSDDIGDYTCLARNGEGQISHTARVIVAGGAVIVNPPQNDTKLEGEKVQFSCEAKALPGNVSVRWFREGALISEISELDTRASIKMDGSLVISPVSADDSGLYLCEVTNGIGEPQTASAYLNVEYPAKVTFNPTVQYLPFRMAGVVHCYIKANPPLQYVTWTKDKRLLEPYQIKDIVVMTNGSLLFTRVNENHQGKYTCTPYNAHGTQGSSGQMDVLVRNPPQFTVEPEAMYQRKVGETVEMHCDAQESDGTQRPTIAWQRRDGELLPKNRAKYVGGNLTIESLRRQDFGAYHCVATNEVATIIKSTQLIVEGTQPHAPHNITGIATEFSVTLSWLAGYSGGPDYKQDYTIWYREEGAVDWKTIPVTPSGSTTVTISRLKPGTNHEFQVVGKNALGDGMFSKVITVKTLDVGLQQQSKPPPKPVTVPTGTQPGNQAAASDQGVGPRPGPPRNVTISEISNGFLITWQPPLERSHLIKGYTISFKTDGPWKTMNKGKIRPEDTSYLMKNLVGGRTYYFQVFANSTDNVSAGASDLVKYAVAARVKHKAITAGVVGGILFFIVAIILSICAVKICNKRKRRKQEKELLSAYNMVACRVTDARNGAGQGTVPLKKSRKSRVPGLSLLREIVSPSTPELNMRGRPLSKISRAADGRFVISDSVLSSPNDSTLDASSSDDGGFLPSKKHRPRCSWRRPLVDIGTSPITMVHSRSRPVVPTIYRQCQQQHLLVPGPQSMPTIPVSSHFMASSPGSGAPQDSLWNPSLYHGDLSSVRQASSVERTFGPSSLPTPGYHHQLRSLHERYSQELPPLRAIHAESQQTRLVRVQASRARLPPRHARHARSAPELAASPDLETSPESRSSSSGFGSKNTSQQNQSSRSGSTVTEWRPPPYRPPPPPLVGRWLELQQQQQPQAQQQQSTGVKQAQMLPNCPQLDAGSVDGHYEFDPVSCTPTPTSASTPTREERPPAHGMPPHMHHQLTVNGYHHHQQQHQQMIEQVHTVNYQQQQPRYSRENIEARVEAMKAEFHQFRQRQARRRQSAHVESAC